MTLFYLPFALQSILMFIDERFHVKRGLGLWERLGHPLDSLTVFVPMSMAATNEFTPSKLNVYIALAIFSCGFITKDEWVHAKECGPVECWLHSVLFVTHPILFFTTGYLWKNHPDEPLLFIQPIMIGIFMLYQVCKWSLTWKEAK